MIIYSIQDKKKTQTIKEETLPFKYLQPESALYYTRPESTLSQNMYYWYQQHLNADSFILKNWNIFYPPMVGTARANLKLENLSIGGETNGLTVVFNDTRRFKYLFSASTLKNYKQ